MPTVASAESNPLQDVVRAVRRQSESLREKYRDDPVALAELLGLKLPTNPLELMKIAGVYDPEKHGEIQPGLRELVEDVCLGRVDSAVAVANRGGGKSQGVSYIEFFLVFIKDFDALNLGGSELQADQVYQYIMGYIESSPEWQRMVKGDPLQSKTTTMHDAWIRVLTASQKSVRSPHAGGRKKGGRMAGGLLVIDEEAETDPDIVAAALHTINTAMPSVSVRCSTFHNLGGSFEEVVENAAEMGYKKYGWNIFSVCSGCECRVPGVCESEEKCFREDHVVVEYNPETGQEEDRLIHKAYCGGQALFGRGWIPIKEIVKLWKRMKRNHANWEVEAMGSRPTSSGFVIKDRTSYRENVTDKLGDELYMDGWPVTICVDWGTVAAGIEVWQEHPGDVHVLLDAEQVEEAGSSTIIAAIQSRMHKYATTFLEVAADIGGGGNYLNKQLREMGINCRDVNFAEVKESAVAAWNILNEAHNIKYPEEFGQFHDQARSWKRINGRIGKGNDHLMDTAICYFAKFIERLGTSNIRVPPRTFSSAPSLDNQSGSHKFDTAAVNRLPVFASIGRSKT